MTGCFPKEKLTLSMEQVMIWLCMNPASSTTPSANPVPLYFKIKRILEGRVLAGEFPVGSQLPAEHEFCREYAASRNTLRKALELMEQEGVIQRFRGKGSFVRKLPVEAAAPFIGKEQEIRCYVPAFFRETWGSQWFQQAFRREFPGVRLSTHGDMGKGQNKQDDRCYLGMDFYVMPSAYVREAEERFLVGDWREILGEEYWREVVEDIPADVARAIGDDFLPKQLPVTFCPLVLVYNKNIFDAAGIPYPRFNWSEAEFLTTCAQIAEYGKTRRVFPFLCEFFSTKRWPFAIYREGGRIWSEDGTRCMLDSENSLKGIRFLKELSVEKKYIKAIIGAETTADCSFFVRDRVAIQLASFATVNLLKQNTHRNWGMVALPEGKKRSTVMTECNFTVSPHVRERSLLGEFIRFTRQPEILAAQFEEQNIPLASRKGLQKIEAETSEENRRILRKFLQATPEMEPLEYPASRTAVHKLEELINHVWIDPEYAEEHCMEICQEINRMPELQFLVNRTV